jgi:hypothetical protein
MPTGSNHGVRRVRQEDGEEEVKYDSKGNPICPVKMGDRLVVMGRPEKAIVEDIQWYSTEDRWRIILDWGQYGKSKVWSSDEGKTWVHITSLN